MGHPIVPRKDLAELYPKDSLAAKSQLAQLVFLDCDPKDHAPIDQSPKWPPEMERVFPRKLFGQNSLQIPVNIGRKLP